MMEPAEIARVAHEVNRVFCEYLGDTTQKPWEFAPQWQRDSAISGVMFTIENPNAGDAASHENWRREKDAAGWRYGEVKDEVEKTHPCMRPFGDLPHAQQMKDRFFRTVVLSCLECD